MTITIGNEYRYTGPDWGLTGYRVKVVGVWVWDEDGEGYMENDPTEAPVITKADAVEVVAWHELERRWIAGTMEVDACDLVEVTL